MSSNTEFLQAIMADDGSIDLAHAALAIAADQYPQLDTARYLAQLDDYAARVRARMSGSSGIGRALDALDAVLIADEGFSGNTDDYYDPRNSYLNDVMDRRQGIPITLCVLYIEVARRAGTRLEPIGFPSHFMLSAGHGTARCFIDPFRGGRRLTAADLRGQLDALMGAQRAGTLFPRAVAAVPATEVVARMLRNLKLIHFHAEDWHRALAVSNRLLAVTPDDAAERRDRGVIHEHLQAWRAALSDYQNYLQRHADATDAGAVRERVEELRKRVSRLN